MTALDGHTHRKGAVAAIVIVVAAATRVVAAIAIMVVLAGAVIVIAAAALIPLLIAFIAMKIKSSKMHTARHNDYAANYEKPGSMKLSQSHDVFLYSTTQRTKKVKVEAQPGTSHTSSSAL